MGSGVKAVAPVQERNADPLEHVDYRLAETTEARDAIYRLRYRAYLREGAILPSASERVSDRYDDLPNTFIFGIHVRGELFSSIRVSVLSSDCRESPSAAMFPDLLLPELDRLGLVYVHCVEGEPVGINNWTGPPGREFDFAAARKMFGGAWIANNAYDPPRAASKIAAGEADLVSFGRPFIANPDFPERVRRGAPLNELDLGRAYAGQAEAGYTDYPALEREPAE